MSGFTDVRFAAAPNSGKSLSHIVVNGRLQSHLLGKMATEKMRERKKLNERRAEVR
jgi:hypothetical protein